MPTLKSLCKSLGWERTRTTKEFVEQVKETEIERDQWQKKAEKSRTEPQGELYPEDWIPTDEQIEAHLNGGFESMPHTPAVMKAISDFEHRRHQERARRDQEEHERRTREFNRIINERKDAIKKSKPAISLVRTAPSNPGKTFVVVRINKAPGAQVLDQFVVLHRAKGTTGWSQYGVHRRSHEVPCNVTLKVDSGKTNEVVCCGSNKYGRIHSDPIIIEKG